MEAGLDPGARFMVEDLLNFTLDGAGEEDDDYDENALKAPPSSCTSNSQDPDDRQSLSLPEFAEEELEWLSNKDAFPSVETCLDILSHHPGIASSHQSPVSVLESTTATTPTTTSTTSNNSSITSYCSSGSGSGSGSSIILVPVRYPVKARSKRRRRWPGGFSEQYWSWGQEKPEFRPAPPPRGGTATMGRWCRHCGSDKTPQWRAGPMGPKTLCNACGVRYKSGRLVPEYRPASSPTFSNLLHSNSHRKVMEMRRQKQMAEMDSAL